MKASMEYQASGDLGPLQPDTPQNSVRSLLNAILLKQAPNQVGMHPCWILFKPSILGEFHYSPAIPLCCLTNISAFPKSPFSCKCDFVLFNGHLYRPIMLESRPPSAQTTVSGSNTVPNARPMLQQVIICPRTQMKSPPDVTFAVEPASTLSKNAAPHGICCVSGCLAASRHVWRCVDPTQLLDQLAALGRRRLCHCATLHAQAGCWRTGMHPAVLTSSMTPCLFPLNPACTS